MSFPNRNFGDAIAVQDLSGNFVRGSPLRTKILEPLLADTTLLERPAVIVNLSQCLCGRTSGTWRAWRRARSSSRRVYSRCATRTVGGGADGTLVRRREPAAERNARVAPSRIRGFPHRTYHSCLLSLFSLHVLVNQNKLNTC